MIKDSGFNYGANAYCDYNETDFDDNPDDDNSPMPDDGFTTLEKYVDIGPSNILGAPDGRYEYVGFGDTVYARFLDNVPRNGYGADIIIYTEIAPNDKFYSIVINDGTDFIDRTGILYHGLKDIEIDLSDLEGDFGDMEMAILADPYNQNGPLGIDAIEALYNE